MKEQVRERLTKCYEQGVAQGLWSTAANGLYNLEEPKQAGHGDFATNFAMVVAGKERKKPREVAALLMALLAEHGDLFKKIEVAGPGFVNIFVNDAIWHGVLAAVGSLGAAYGLSKVGCGRKVLVEFVSANPTGPLSVGHSRQAVLGDAIARLLIATGHNVTREYYYNDAGRQMRVLGESTRARYLELLGLPHAFPEDGYQGEYIVEIARDLIRDVGDSLKDSVSEKPFKERAEKAIMADINHTLERLGIRFDNYFNEHTLYDNGQIDEVVAILRDKGLVYDQDGAVWFRTTEFGHDKDRVIIKNTGEPTYRLPDIAYHREKFRRGFDWMVNVFGSDHIATVPDVLAGVSALGYDASKVTAVIHQFVTLLRDGHQVKMSTRRATFVTVDELLDEVGADVSRFFFLMRRADSQLEFDVELAKKESQENPVYYVQYAFARLSSIVRLAASRGVTPDSEGLVHLLTLPEEIGLLKAMAFYPDLVVEAGLELEPHRIIYFLQDLAGQFHSYYNKHRVITEDEALTRARLQLAQGLRIVIGNGLRLLGLTTPEEM
ncbi:MAG: arginine--tRNA ligase [Deltaproteobacteria bacterium RIFOXYD12_FULL_50_9]|nr:MAG: arginine--tRNA ligase [Deltaproteobacteria bacterium RIFOXYD12_FULL_50_9]